MRILFSFSCSMCVCVSVCLYVLGWGIFESVTVHVYMSSSVRGSLILTHIHLGTADWPRCFGSLPVSITPAHEALAAPLWVLRSNSGLNTSVAGTLLSYLPSSRHFFFLFYMKIGQLDILEIYFFILSIFSVVYIVLILI